MRGEVEHFLLDADAGPAVAEVFAQDVQLGLADGIKRTWSKKRNNQGLPSWNTGFLMNVFQIGRLRPTSW